MNAPTCPCGTDVHRSDEATDESDLPSCSGCERFFCEGCSRWVPWDDGADDEDAGLCDDCADAITARPTGSSR